MKKTALLYRDERLIYKAIDVYLSVDNKKQCSSAIPYLHLAKDKCTFIYSKHFITGRIASLVRRFILPKGRTNGTHS